MHETIHSTCAMRHPASHGDLSPKSISRLPLPTLNFESSVRDLGMMLRIASNAVY